jgi:hypothetical protein
MVTRGTDLIGAEQSERALGGNRHLVAPPGGRLAEEFSRQTIRINVALSNMFMPTSSDIDQQARVLDPARS